MGTYIIAEAGVNHNGDIEIAKKLISEAKKTGANCVKFQTFSAKNIAREDAPKAKYQLKTTNNSESQFDMLSKLELKKTDFIDLKLFCEKIKIDFMSTPYDKEDIDLLESIGVNQYKIASGQLTEFPFLRHVAKKNKKIILSTGMATLDEVFLSVNEIRKYHNDISVLQCTTNYPSKIEDANINAMLTIKNSCKVEVGYSDHVIENYGCYAAVALGAKIIEKHFTLDNQMSGPDHSCSLDPSNFKVLVDGIRKIELSLGDGHKEPSINEIKNIYGMKRGMVAKTIIKKNQIINEKNIAFKRPFDGLSPNFFDKVIGKRAIKDIQVDEPIMLSSIIW